MNSTNEIKASNNEGTLATSSSANTNNDANNSSANNKNNTIATSSSDQPKQEPPQQKKKKPIQHLLAGGTAGFVESSICHPLDTIKTRMQLRRQTTNRKVIRKNVEGVMGRALGSMRDAEGASTNTSSASTNAGKSGESLGGAAKKNISGGGSGGVSGNATANKVEAAAKGALHRTTETVRVKPDLSSKAEATSVSSSSSATTQIKTATHDIGWKQRLPSAFTAAKATTSTTTKATTTASSSASSSAMTGVVQAPLGPFGTARRIIQREGPLALYKGLTAVYTGIVPKMAIRFVSFEYYRDVLGGWHYGQGVSPPTNPTITFFAGLLSGLTEAIVIVTPAEVCKIRMQSQYHSLIDPSQKPQMNAKYKNVVQTAALIVKEEGFGALYKGVVPTMMRQGCNQAVNFSVYNYSKKRILAWKKKKMEEEQQRDGGGGGKVDVQLDHWQSLLLGGLSGGMGPLVNNPLGE